MPESEVLEPNVCSQMPGFTPRPVPISEEVNVHVMSNVSPALEGQDEQHIIILRHWHGPLDSSPSLPGRFAGSSPNKMRRVVRFTFAIYLRCDGPAQISIGNI